MTPSMAESTAGPPDADSAKSWTVSAWLWARTLKSPDPAFADGTFPWRQFHAVEQRTAVDLWLEPDRRQDAIASQSEQENP